MAETFVEKDGKACWRCGWCHAVHEEMSMQGGAYVKVANVLVAIVCTDQCLAPAQAAIEALFEPAAAAARGRP